MNLAEFADEYLGTGRHRSPSKTSIRRDFLSKIPGSLDESRDARLLSMIWWQVMMRSPKFFEILQEAGIKPNRLKETEMMIVKHGRGAEAYDMIILDPHFSSSTPLVLSEITASADDFKSGWAQWGGDTSRAIRSISPGMGLKRQSNLKRYRQISQGIRAEALYEVGKEENFQILIARLPELEFTASNTGVFSSPLGVAPVPGGQPTSTVGASAKDKKGRKGVTICLHAIIDALGEKNIHPGKTSVEIGNTIGIIQSVDPVSDSCFVEINLHHDPERAQPLAGKSPRNEFASFSGIKSGSGIKAYIQSWSPDIPFCLPYSQLKVFTTAVTNPGDSGAPLMDSEGKIVAFSFYRTQINQEPSFSSWIWADSVFQFHHLL